MKRKTYYFVDCFLSNKPYDVTIIHAYILILITK